MDFKDFAKNYIPKEEKQPTNNNYEEIISKYQNLSQEELMQELFKQSAQLKQSGKWDPDKMKNISSTIAPYLSDEQKKMLDDLSKKLNQ